MATQKSKAAPGGWKAQNRAWHKVTPPSAMTGMELRIPSLTELIQNDAVPERLRSVALKAAAHPAGLRGVMTDELNKANEDERSDEELLEDDTSTLKKAINDVIDIQKYLIADENVRVDGVFLTLADLDDPDFPEPDKEWLGGVMLREVEYDAQGVRLGIEQLSTWERFRHFHDCGPDCSACAALQDALSSVDLGRV